MSETQLLASAMLLALLGLLLQALSLENHWHQAGGQGQPPATPLRIAGWLSLAASLAACLGADHVSMAALVWPMILAAAAALVALGFSGLSLRKQAEAPGRSSARKPRHSTDAGAAD